MRKVRVLLGSTTLLILMMIALAPATAAAQATPTPPPPAQTPEPEPDEAEPVPAEPDFRLVNLPTTLWLPVKGMSFGLTHRFVGNLRSGGFVHQLENVFGLDQGASIGLEFRYGIARHVQAVVFRTNIDKTLQFYGKWDAIRQNATRPLSVSLMASVEGNNNFRIRRQPAIGAIVSRQIREKLAVYAVPMWVHGTAAAGGFDQDTAAAAGIGYNTMFLGLGGKARVSASVYLVAEVSPRLSGYTPNDAEYGFGIEKRVGGHVFQLNFSNTIGTTFGQTARGGLGDTLYLGFNLGRKYF
jgi:hypothetical protein